MRSTNPRYLLITYRAHSPAAKHFDAIYAVKQPYKIHINV